MAIMDLAENHPVERYRGWYEIYAKERAEEDAEGAPWKSGDIAIFAKEAEIAPKNHRDLFELTVCRLLDLKAELEDGDTSIAEILLKVEEETTHRNVIADWLRKQSHGRYSVPQEEELTDRKKPDIRIHSSGFDGPVPIELKLADNWSPNELVERMNNQLCGQYLRDDHSNCGIFLLLYLGRKRYWIHPTTRKWQNFYDLIQFIKVEAVDIVSKESKIEGIEVIGIDITKRGK